MSAARKLPSPPTAKPIAATRRCVVCACPSNGRVCRSCVILAERARKESTRANASPVVRQPMHQDFGPYRIWARSNGSYSVVDSRIDVVADGHLLAVFGSEGEAVALAQKLEKGAKL